MTGIKAYIDMEDVDVESFEVESDGDEYTRRMTRRRQLELDLHRRTYEELDFSNLD